MDFFRQRKLRVSLRIADNKRHKLFGICFTFLLAYELLICILHGGDRWLRNGLILLKEIRAAVVFPSTREITRGEIAQILHFLSFYYESNDSTQSRNDYKNINHMTKHRMAPSLHCELETFRTSKRSHSHMSPQLPSPWREGRRSEFNIQNTCLSQKTL
jgi:hypothetical protein